MKRHTLLLCALFCLLCPSLRAQKVNSDEFKELAGWMKKIGRALEDATARMRPAIADEHYLQGEEVCGLLHVSKRTLQTLRDEGAIPYTTIGGKILYPESALYETLRKNYRNYRQYAG